MAMWDIHLVERLAERQGSIGKEEKAHMVFTFHLHAHAIYPGAIVEEATEDRCVYHLHLLPGAASQDTVFTYSQPAHQLARLHSSPVLPSQSSMSCLPASQPSH
jgi:hypothetical protein